MIETERITSNIEGRYYVAEASIDYSDIGYTGEAIKRLAIFENMLEELKASQEPISEELEKLRGQGKEKSVRFKELMVKKLTNINTLMLFKSYGIE